MLHVFKASYQKEFYDPTLCGTIVALTSEVCMAEVDISDDKELWSHMT